MIIDSFNHHPDPEFIAHQLEVLSESPGYLSMFGPRLVQSLGVDVSHAPQDSEMSLLKWSKKQLSCLTHKPEEFLRQLDNAGIDKVIVHDEDLGPERSIARLRDGYWKTMKALYRGRLLILGSVHPLRSESYLTDVLINIQDGVYHGLFLSPFQQRCSIIEGDYDKIFAECDAQQIPVWLHSGIHWDRRQTLKENRPHTFERILLKYKNIKLIAGHAGWPWVPEMCALAMKFPNLYLELSAHRPKYMIPGSGWEALLVYSSNLLRNKIIVGTASTILNLPPSLVREEYTNLFGKQLADMYFSENPRKIYNV